MARIRSVHPSLFTDEAFAGLSMAARVLLIGVWTEADDQGVFDWKPVTLKMRVMPADNVDVSELLAELAAADAIKKFEEGGRQLGAIRNFCKFQRPKTPKYRALKSDDIRKYVASTYPTSEAGEVQPQQFPQKGEMTAVERPPILQIVETHPQMEDGGDKGGGKESKKNSSPVAKATRPDPKFEEFWREYPKRDGDNPRKPAEKKFLALVKTGVDPDAIIAGAKQATAAARARGKFGTEFVPQAVKWLNDQRWIDHAAIAFDEPAAAIDWDAQVARFKRGIGWSAKWYGPEPGQHGCRAPPEVLAKYGYRDEVGAVQ